MLAATLLLCVAVVVHADMRKSAADFAAERAAEELKPLLVALRDPTPLVRIQTLNRIADLKGAGERGASAVGELALHDPDAEVRRAARDALREFHDAHAALMDTLLAAAASPDTIVRASAVTSLGEVAELSDRALPRLLGAVGDRSASVESACGKGLDDVTRIWPGQLPRLVDVFVHCDPRARFHVGNAIAPAGVTAVPALLPLLGYADWSVRANATRVLGIVGETDGAVGKALAAELDDPDFRIRQYALQALGRLGTPFAHDTMVQRNHGVETHGAPRDSLMLNGGYSVKPDTSIVAVVAEYRKFRPPLEEESFGSEAEDVTIAEERRLYVCDVDARTIRLLARIDVPAELRWQTSVSIHGWLGDSIAVEVYGRPARNPTGLEYAADSRLVIIDPRGGCHTVTALPRRPQVSRGYRDAPRGARRFLRVSVDAYGGEVAKYENDGPKIVVFRARRGTGELLPVRP